MRNLDWTTAKVSKLITGWNSGQSGGEIADTFGISRNAVMGKVFRLRKQGYKLAVRKFDPSTKAA